MFYISQSQIKTANASMAKRVGESVLGIKKDFSSDAFILGNAFESYLCEGIDNIDSFCKDTVYNKAKLEEDYLNLKYNSQGIRCPEGELQKKIKGELFGHSFIGYADIYTENCIFDIKTNRYLTDPNKGYPNSWSGMTTYEEYELQMWCYMKVSNTSNSKIIEVSKHRYKDGRNANLTFDIAMTDEFDKRMTKKFMPIIEEMHFLYCKYKSLGKDI